MERVDKMRWRTRGLICKKRLHQKFCQGQISPCWDSWTTHTQPLRCPLGDTRVPLKEIKRKPFRVTVILQRVSGSVHPQSFNWPQMWEQGAARDWCLLIYPTNQGAIEKFFNLWILSIFLSSYLFLDIHCNSRGNQLSVFWIFHCWKCIIITAFIVLYDLPQECSVCTGDCS